MTFVNRLNQGSLFNSVINQTPNPYWSLDDQYPQYVQVQRTPAKISGTTVNFKLNAFDPNAFIRSKAYIKLDVSIRKVEISQVDGKEDNSDYSVEDRIYKKPGLVLHNSCTNASLRLNSHTMNYKDLRYVTKKLNTSFAGKDINNNYFTTSGGNYENYNGVYNEFGCINKIVQNTADVIEIPIAQFGFDVATPNRISYETATNELSFVENGGDTINLISTQIFIQGDGIILASGAIFIVNFILDDDILNATRIDTQADLAEQDIDAADIVLRERACSFQGDDGREISYDQASENITVGQSLSTFKFTESLSFGPFNHLADYGPGEIYKNSWNLKQSPLIPYIRELELNMSFKDIAANSLIYPYGRSNNPAVENQIELRDISIDNAELVIIWVKPRDELLLSMPPRVRIQSWMYEHKEFDLGLVNNESSVETTNNNIYTQQVPSYLLYYAMVDKDSDTSYKCRSINTDSDGIGGNASISVDRNSVETGMRHLLDGDGSSFNLRSNTLGGDDILDERYNNKELYRIMLKNSMSTFPWSETKFNALLSANNTYATYPSQSYILLGEQELNSFFIRKGQLQVSNVMNYKSTLVASDGYSISKPIQAGAFNGGNKNYKLHIVYLYDRFYIELCNDEFVDSRFDAQFF